MEVQSLQNLLIALGLGLLVGLQREWAESPLGGIRSFSLVSLLGAVTSILSKSLGSWIIGMGFAGIILILVLGQFFYLKNIDTSKHRGLVTHFSFLLVFCIGVMTELGHATLAASIAGILAIVLHIKFELHTLVTKFDKNEIRSIMQFVLILLVIFPMIPNQNYGPYNAINPHNIWFMVVLIVGISLFGYIVYKFFGHRAGIFSSGILGGVVSSTATTITSARNSFKDSNPSYYAIIILLAWATLYGRVALELSVVAPGFNSTYIPLAVMTFISFLPLVWIYRKSHNNFNKVQIQNSPTKLNMALTFAILYAGILLATSYLKEEFGNKGLIVLALFSGVADVDAITLSTGRLVSTNALSESEGHTIILTAICSNNFFKGLITLTLGGKELFKVVLLPWLITLGTGILLIFFT